MNTLECDAYCYLTYRRNSYPMGCDCSFPFTKENRMNQPLPQELIDQIAMEERHFATAPQAFFET